MYILAGTQFLHLLTTDLTGYIQESSASFRIEKCIF